jgi:hypothetical protein
MYPLGKSEVSALLNRPLYEFLGLTSTIIQTISFCNINIFLLLDELFKISHLSKYTHLNICNRLLLLNYSTIARMQRKVKLKYINNLIG